KGYPAPVSHQVKIGKCSQKFGLCQEVTFFILRKLLTQGSLFDDDIGVPDSLIEAVPSVRSGIDVSRIESIKVVVLRTAAPPIAPIRMCTEYGDLLRSYHTQREIDGVCRRFKIGSALIEVFCDDRLGFFL